MYFRRKTSRSPRPRHDVASQSINMDLFEAEVCALCKLEAGWALMPYWETICDLNGGWLLFNWQTKSILLGPPDRLASSQPASLSEPVMWMLPKTAFSQASRWLGSSIVPSQTCWLVHTQAIKSDSMPLQSTMKLFVWACILKPLAQNKIEELNHARVYPNFYCQYLEKYDILCCPVFQVVGLCFKFYF